MTESDRGMQRLALELIDHGSGASTPTHAGESSPRLARPRRPVAPWLEAALDAALDCIAGSSFVVSPRGKVVHANSSGRVLLQVARASTEARIASSTKRFAISRPGRRRYAIVVLEPSEGEASARAEAVTEEFGLSPRESQVLGLLATGMSNRLIGLELGCAEKTVEAHVSSILARTGSPTRTSLVARFWTHSLRAV